MPPNAYTNIVCLHMLIHTWTMYKYVPTHSLWLLAPTKALSLHANKNIVNTCPHKHGLSTFAYRNMVYVYICLHKQGLCLHLLTQTLSLPIHVCINLVCLTQMNLQTNVSKLRDAPKYFSVFFLKAYVIFIKKLFVREKQ